MGESCFGDSLSHSEPRVRRAGGYRFSRRGIQHDLSSPWHNRHHHHHPPVVIKCHPQHARTCPRRGRRQAPNAQRRRHARRPREREREAGQRPTERPGGGGDGAAERRRQQRRQRPQRRRQRRRRGVGEEGCGAGGRGEAQRRGCAAGGPAGGCGGSIEGGESAWSVDTMVHVQDEQHGRAHNGKKCQSTCQWETLPTLSRPNRPRTWRGEGEGEGRGEGPPAGRGGGGGGAAAAGGGVASAGLWEQRGSKAMVTGACCVRADTVCHVCHVVP